MNHSKNLTKKLALGGVQMGMINGAVGHGTGQAQLCLRHIDMAIGVGGDLPHSAHMVKMAMGQQNGLDFQPQQGGSVQNGVGFIAGVDDDAFFSPSLWTM